MRDAMSDNKVLAIVPARGGSKGIPRKNIRPFVGHPLIAYSIAAGLQAKLVTRVIVTTDDEEIAGVGPVDPEIYTYFFLVDGVKMIDLGNPVMKVGATIDASVAEVPGNPPRFDEVQNVPHGSIHIHTYKSTAENMQRGLYIYVPPEYYSEPNRRFPVLYLWHGGGGSGLSSFRSSGKDRRGCAQSGGRHPTREKSDSKY